MDDVYERRLLATWFMNHREDAKYLEPQMFTRKTVFEMVMDGKSYEQIKEKTNTDITAKEVYEAMTDFIGYREALAEAMNEQKNIYLDRAKKGDMKKWFNKAEEIQTWFDGDVVKANLTDFADYFMKCYTEECNEQNPHYGVGFKSLDYYTRGIHKGQLTTIGARPKVGKSSMGLQVAYNVAMEGFKVIYLPLEMTPYEMMKRVLVHAQVVSPDELTNPNEYIVEQIKLFLDRLEADGNLIFCDLNKITALTEKIRQEKPYVVVIDQLSHLYPAESYKTTREKYVANTRELKRLALDENIAIILLSQINRDSEEKSEPTLESLSESDSIGQDSDNVFILYTREENAQEEEMRNTFLKIVKQRGGVSGKKLCLKFDGARYTFWGVTE